LKSPNSHSLVTALRSVPSLSGLDDGALLELLDSKGRTVVVPPDRLAYVEIGEEGPRRAGFVS
jgi:hypothetical protein